MNFEIIMRELLAGFGNTLLLFAVTLALSLPLGVLISIGSRSKIKPVKFLLKGVVWIIRSTPLMLQVLVVSLVPRYVFGTLNKELADFFGVSIKSLMFIFVATAFVINYACYFSEIFRGAAEAVPKGQREAGKVLGMTKMQIFRHVVLFQVIKKVLAPLSNEAMSLVKDTALASVLGVVDLYTAANGLVNTYVVLTPLFYAAIFYLAFNGLLTLLFGYAEKKTAFYKE